MNELTQNSEESGPEEMSLKIQAELKKVRDQLREKGVDPSGLVVLRIGEEQVLGQTVDATQLVDLVGKPVRLKNPHRLLRIQRINGEQFSVNFTVVDYDMVETGVCVIIADMALLLDALDPESQLRYSACLLGYLQNKEKMKEIMRNGGSRIVRPDLQVPPGMLSPGALPFKKRS